MRKSLLALLSMAALAAIMCAGIVNADIIYSNLGTGDPYDLDPYDGWAIVGGGQDLAMKFTVAGDSRNLSTIELALTYLSSTYSRSLRISLASDSSGVPGSIIESMYLNEDYSSSPHLATVTSLSRPLLQTGCTYWVVAQGVTKYDENNNLIEQGRAGWNWNTIDQYGMAWTNGSWSGPSDWRWREDKPSMLTSAFRVSGDINVVQIPEPSSILALLAGMGSFAGIVLKSRRK